MSHPHEEEITAKVLEMLLEKGLGSDTKTKAADLEISIVDAINTGKPRQYQTLALSVAQYLKANGISGAATKPPKGKAQVSQTWLDYGGTDITPKTDILVGNNSRISLKMGASQFMSGEKGEAKATLLAAVARLGLKDEVAKRALAAADKLKKNVKYSTYVTDIRQMPGYVNPETGIKNVGRANKEVQTLMSQEMAQVKFQKELAAVLDPAVNPGLKLAFVQEAMDGKVKFANGIGTANYLLTVAGEGTIYGVPGREGGVGGGLVQLGTAADKNLKSFFHFEKIDKNLAAKYQKLVNVSVKFKTREHGSRISDVVGLMLQEANDFRTKLKTLLSVKKETRYTYKKTINMLNEGAFDDLKSMLGSAWTQVKALWEKALTTIDALGKDLMQKIVNAAQEGTEALLDFLGIDMDVEATNTIDWNAV